MGANLFRVEILKVFKCPKSYEKCAFLKNIKKTTLLQIKMAPVRNVCPLASLPKISIPALPGVVVDKAKQIRQLVDKSKKPKKPKKIT